jgi:hypothetical protein
LDAEEWDRSAAGKMDERTEPVGRDDKSADGLEG